MNIVTQFLSFDKLIGQGLVKIVYFLGLIGIVLSCLFWIFTGLTMMSYIGFGGFLGILVGAIIGVVLGSCFWRFACEIYLVLYRLGEDLSAIRAGGGTL